MLAGNSSLILYNGTPDGTKAIAPGKDALGTLEENLAKAQQALTDAQNQGGDTTSQQAAVTAAKKALDDALTAASANLSDGLWLSVLDFLPANGLTNKQGLYALEQADLFNILCLPPYHAPPTLWMWM